MRPRTIWRILFPATVVLLGLAVFTESLAVSNPWTVSTSGGTTWSLSTIAFLATVVALTFSAFWLGVAYEAPDPTEGPTTKEGAAQPPTTTDPPVSRL
jgi:hypothetical protein